MWPIDIGTKALDEYIVRKEDTAIMFDSGGLDVLATPMLICSAERSCKNLVDPLLEPGQGTVGTLVNIRHLAPTPVGMKYRCECEVIAVEGRMVRFHVELHDETELIGEGIHERYVIDNSRFMGKVNHKHEQRIETQLTDLIEEQIRTAIGQKVLEFGTGTYTLAHDLCGKTDLSCTDKSMEALRNAMRTKSEADSVSLIPDSELEEDCYFGRFHMVYSVFAFHGLQRLVDEIMRLRRLIIKGGKMVIVDIAADNFENECIKQLKRCGFEKISTTGLEIEGKPAFLISAEK